eukprot:CAMPEP_0172456278 /NCGR_PEP_ID=MMETSP1065-20121228/14770_1 /TAXON_ID=265537 /ORGANISM="Amphiprora paludosa, Strain CCMP125" /LENGTH=317 /DNA_ID=CAMNT_0013209099 /DNA_START=153 /DNA_END=1106 /DNA_ORIENTATION=+
MNMRTATLTLFALASTSNAFAPTPLSTPQTTALQSSLLGNDMGKEIRREVNYQPGKADTDFARRYGHLVGSDVRTVGEAFAQFTKELGYTVNPLYKNMVTDLVGTTHLITVNARFQRDSLWCLGIVTALDLLLKNYPEGPEMRENIMQALMTSVGMDLKEVRTEAAAMEFWAKDQTKESIEQALMGEGSSPLAEIAKVAKGDEYWMYSRYFGIGLLKLMETVGMEMDKDEVYPVMEDWMANKLGRSALTACADSDLFFKVKSKLDMMETMMKEIEIREKKRMAERLEEKAEAALRAAEREKEWQKEVDAANKEKVDA